MTNIINAKKAPWEVDNPKWREEFEAEILETSNTFRAKHHAPALVINPEIAVIAQDWANYLAKINKTVHRPDNKYGENIFYKWHKKHMICGSEVPQSFYNEIKYYYPYFQKEPNLEHFHRFGHFSQLLWRESEECGTGIAVNGDKIFIVINYHPRGNWPDEYAGNVLPAVISPQAMSALIEANPHPDHRNYIPPALRGKVGKDGEDLSGIIPLVTTPIQPSPESEPLAKSDPTPEGKEPSENLTKQTAKASPAPSQNAKTDEKASAWQPKDDGQFNNVAKQSPKPNLEAPPKEQPQDLLPQTKVPQVTRTKEPQMTQIKEPQMTQMKEPQMTQTKEPQVTQAKEPQVTRPKEPQVTQTWEPQVTRPKEPQMTQTWEPQVTRPKEPQVIQTWEPQVTRPKEPQMTQTWEPQVTRPKVPQVKQTWEPQVTRPKEPQVKQTWEPQVTRPKEPQMTQTWEPQVTQIKEPEVTVPKTGRRLRNANQKGQVVLPTPVRPKDPNLTGDETLPTSIPSGIDYEKTIMAGVGTLQSIRQRPERAQYRKIPDKKIYPLVRNTPRGVAREVPKDFASTPTKELPKDIRKTPAKVLTNDALKEPFKEIIKDIQKDAPKIATKDLSKDNTAKESTKEMAKDFLKDWQKITKDNYTKEESECSKKIPNEQVKEGPALMEGVNWKMLKNARDEEASHVNEVLITRPKAPEQVRAQAKVEPRVLRQTPARALTNDARKETVKGIKDVQKDGPKMVTKELSKGTAKEPTKELAKDFVRDWETMTKDIYTKEESEYSKKTTKEQAKDGPALIEGTNWKMPKGARYEQTPRVNEVLINRPKMPEQVMAQTKVEPKPMKSLRKAFWQPKAAFRPMPMLQARQDNKQTLKNYQMRKSLAKPMDGPTMMDPSSLGKDGTKALVDDLSKDLAPAGEQALVCGTGPNAEVAPVKMGDVGPKQANK